MSQRDHREEKGKRYGGRVGANITGRYNKGRAAKTEGVKLAALKL